MKRKRILLSASIAFALLLLAALAWTVARRLTRGVLLVTAHVSRSGADVPLPGAKLYLLDEDMMRLTLVSRGEPSPLQEKVFRENPKLKNLAGVMNARRREAYSLGPEVADFMEQSRPLWQPHVLQSVETDGQGRAAFYNLASGDYWLMAGAETGDGGVAFWNLFVTVKRGETSVKLEPLNSLQCSGCR